MLPAPDVLRLLDLLAAAGVRVWVDGGWGVDALLGTATRPHADLDLVLYRDDLAVARDTLTGAGFRTVLRDWLPAALALADDAGREVDLHPVTPAGDGGGYQELGDGQRFRYPPPVPGTIGGRAVSCVDAWTRRPRTPATRPGRWTSTTWPCCASASASPGRPPNCGDTPACAPPRNNVRHCSNKHRDDME